MAKSAASFVKGTSVSNATKELVSSFKKNKVLFSLGGLDVLHVLRKIATSRKKIKGSFWHQASSF